jgi:hypothetical protein
MMVMCNVHSPGDVGTGLCGSLNRQETLLPLQRCNALWCPMVALKVLWELRRDHISARNLPRSGLSRLQRKKFALEIHANSTSREFPVLRWLLLGAANNYFDFEWSPTWGLPPCSQTILPRCNAPHDRAWVSYFIRQVSAEMLHLLHICSAGLGFRRNPNPVAMFCGVAGSVEMLFL